MNITISNSEYAELLEAKVFLQKLHEMGVEDWEGYSEVRLSLLEKELLTTDDKSTTQGE